MLLVTLENKKSASFTYRGRCYFNLLRISHLTKLSPSFLLRFVRYEDINKWTLGCMFCAFKHELLSTHSIRFLSCFIYQIFVRTCVYIFVPSFSEVNVSVFFSRFRFSLLQQFYYLCLFSILALFLSFFAPPSNTSSIFCCLQEMLPNCIFHLSSASWWPKQAQQKASVYKYINIIKVVFFWWDSEKSCENLSFQTSLSVYLICVDYGKQSWMCNLWPVQFSVKEEESKLFL